MTTNQEWMTERAGRVGEGCKMQGRPVWHASVWADSGDKRQGGGARPSLKVSGRSANRAQKSLDHADLFAYVILTLMGG